MEIEAKYAITGPLTPQTLDQLDLAPYTLRPGEDLRHHDIILDTPERAITASHHALRLRDENGHKILTLKGPGTVTGSVHHRQELEEPLPDDESEATLYDYTAWPNTIAAPVAQMAGLHPLAPLVEMHVRRRTWIVERDGRQVGELALDEGTIEANGKSQPVRELELELKDAGKEPDLQTLDARLCERLPLAPEPLSKLERGLTLLGEEGGGVTQRAVDDTSEHPDTQVSDQASNGQEHHRSDHPVDSKREQRAMTGQTPLQLATRHAIKRYLIRLRKHEPKVRRGENPEDVHDMRVATRRIRSALQLVEPAIGFDAKQLRKMRRRLRSLSHDLGAVRDFDVFLYRLKQVSAEHPETDAGLAVLRAELERRRAAARAELAHALTSAKLERRLQEVEAFTSQPVDLSDEARPVLTRHFAGGAIWRRYEAVLGFECELPGAPEPELHQLRIACKRLRYGIEMFESALGEGTKPILEALVAAQDHLGELHDTVVALQTVGQLRDGDVGAHLATRDDNPEAHAALGAYADLLALRRDELKVGFAPLWGRISDEPFRCALAELIAHL